MMRGKFSLACPSLRVRSRRFQTGTTYRVRCVCSQVLLGGLCVFELCHLDGDNMGPLRELPQPESVRYCALSSA